MDTYQEDTYGERIAGVYDDWYAGYDEAAVATLRELAQGGRALELGIGTGRVALPLQGSGVEVHGVDASEAMLSRLRAKPGGEKLPVTLGNFAGVPVEGQFTLIYVLFNAFYDLLTQEEQIRCFQNVAGHLSTEGVFVIEAFVPDLTRWGAKWAFGEPEPTELNPVLLLWWMRDRVDAERLPPGRVVVEFQFIERRRECYWLILDPDDVSVCLKHPGYETDVLVRAELAALYQVWFGRLTFLRLWKSLGWSWTPHLP